MERVTAAFVDGIGAAGATSGIVTQQQARIFALLYLQERPLSLDDIAAELEQSKSNISLNVRALVEWHLVRRRPVPGSRKDHYEAAVDFFRALQEILERRFRWTVRQVMASVDETRAAVAAGGARGPRAELLRQRLDALGAFFSLVDAGIGAFVRGEPFPAGALRDTARSAPRARRALD
jgi:predicted transcriptional regulator